MKRAKEMPVLPSLDDWHQYEDSSQDTYPQLPLEPRGHAGEDTFRIHGYHIQANRS